MDKIIQSPAFLVRVACMSYNHSAYINNALEGIALQETDFPFVATIIDDASPDGSAGVIMDFFHNHFDTAESEIAYERDEPHGHVAFARHKTNPNCFFAVICLNENHYQRGKSKYSYIREWADTKYFALCEGDDYWTSPGKLQKQVNYLESHPDCTLTFHNALIHWYNSNTPDKIFTDLEERDYSGCELCKKWQVPTASIVCRTEMLEGYGKMFQKFPSIGGDTPLVIQCANNGTVHAFPEVMCVYGKHPDSWTQFDDARKTLIHGVSWEKRSKVFGQALRNVTLENAVGLYNLAIVRGIRQKDYKTALKAFRRSFINHPLLATKAVLRISGDKFFHLLHPSSKRIEKN